MTDARPDLFDLLPALHRTRDARADGQPGLLEALLGLVDEQRDLIGHDLDHALDDVWIETCAEWVVPYIGDLLGVRLARGADRRLADGRPAIDARGVVANAIGLRRRKGTLAALEEVARSATGWPATTVEFFALLAATQHLNHVRPAFRSPAGIRDVAACEALDTPFDAVPRTVDVRKIATGRGRHNIPNVGVFLWRVAAVPYIDQPLVPVDPADGIRFRFHPLGIDAPLRNAPLPEPDISTLSRPEHVPMALTRRALDRDLIASYARGVLRISDDAGPLVPEADLRDNAAAAVPAALRVCDLSDVVDAGGNVTWNHVSTPVVAVDPVLGRVAFPAPLANVPRASFHLGFAGRFGGGAYARPPRPAPTVTVSALGVPSPSGAAADASTLAGALAALPGGQSGSVMVLDSDRYAEVLDLAPVAGTTVEIGAADGRQPLVDVTGGAVHLHGTGGAVVLDGLLVVGGPLRVTGDPASVTLRHCTFVPGLDLTPAGEARSAGSPSIELQLDAGATTEVTIDHCIVGPISARAGEWSLTIADSVVDAPGAGGGARVVPAVVSGALAPFPALAAGAHDLLVTVGDAPPHEITLAGPPADLAAAAAALDAALAPGGVRALAVGDRLVLVASGSGPLDAVTVSDAPGGTAAATLKLSAGAHHVAATLSEPLPAALALTAPAPAVRVVVGAGTAQDVALGPPPATPAAAAAAVETAIRSLAGSPAATAADVVAIDGRLLVVPSADDVAIVFAPASGDTTTAAELGLVGRPMSLAGAPGGEVVGPRCTIDRSTVVGTVSVEQLDASDSIFVAPVWTARRQVGCVRYSAVPAGSRTSARFACYPAGSAPGRNPEFWSLRYGDATYALLHPSCPTEIAEGADEDGEMGVHNEAMAPARRANLRAALEEFLRFSLEAGVIDAL